VRRSQEIADAEAVRAIRALFRRPGTGGRLLTYRRAWGTRQPSRGAPNIDPRVIDAFESGITIAGEIRQIPDDPFDAVSDRTRRTIEEAVLGLLSGAITQPVAA
jgi:hypothetical protein